MNLPFQTTGLTLKELFVLDKLCGHTLFYCVFCKILEKRYESVHYIWGTCSKCQGFVKNNKDEIVQNKIIEFLGKDEYENKRKSYSDTTDSSS